MCSRAPFIPEQMSSMKDLWRMSVLHSLCGKTHYLFLFEVPFLLDAGFSIPFGVRSPDGRSSGKATAFELDGQTVLGWF